MSWRLHLLIEGSPGAPDRIVAVLDAAHAAFTIGRDSDVDLRLDQDWVGSRQCQFSLNADGRPEVVNLDFEWGTSRNGMRIDDPVALDADDRIEIGPTTVTVETIEPIESTSGDRETPPGPVATLEPDPWAETPPGPPAIPDPVAASDPWAVEPPASAPAPPPAAAPAAAIDPDDLLPELRTSDMCLDGVAGRLATEFPEHAARHPGDDLDALVERSLARGRGYGLDTEPHLVQFLRLVLLFDDELADADCSVPDVWFALNNANKPPADRIGRAVRQARRIAARKANTTATPTPPASAGPPAAPPARAAPVSDTVKDDPSGYTQVTRRRPPPTATSGHADTPLAEALEEFLVLSLIGRGGMGEVYRAHDVRLEREVALKVLRSVLPGDKESLLEEARAAARLRHPNIVQVDRYEEYGDGGYLVMELVDGSDAQHILRMLGPEHVNARTPEMLLPAIGLDPIAVSPEFRAAVSGDTPYFRMVAWWIAGICDGLETAHRDGIVHRDIKPSNLVLASDGRMKITDFGLATRRDATVPGAATRVGTPRYLAPERIADWAWGEDRVSTDPRIDIWSVGASMYEFLAGHPAYTGPESGVLHRIVAEDPPPPSREVWAVPETLERICLRAMARSPEDRYLRAGDLADDLRDWLDGVTDVDRAGVISRSVSGWLRRKA